MKQLFTGLLQQTASTLPFGIWQRWSGENLFLPFYHLVSDENPPHIRHLYPIRTTIQFRADLDFLLRHFEPVSLEDVWLHVFSKETFRRPVIHLSFDDGLRECHDVVMPILLEKGVPATFFLNSGFIDNQDLMFRYKASLLVCHSLPNRITNPLSVRYEDRHLLDEWAAAAGLDFSAFLNTCRPYLSSEQVKAMQQKGFTLGAHSVDHPLFGPLPLAEQIQQTVDCLQDLRQRFGLERAVFAFPFTDEGVKRTFFDTVQKVWGEPVLSFGSAGLKRDEVPTNLQRFPLEKTTQAASKVVAGEFAASLLKKMIGKQGVKRAL